ncbi:LpqN/LpqT family lipoprotein [Frigoribacterium sp. PvP121]|jgi:hypothetical protein|uniref:LpqN/LpqT family lipoprotein n=2 Tax=unclassified Frigoribacterium TaxID=2627005 RepID=UPI0035A89886
MDDHERTAGMTTISHPSAEFPARPSVSLEAPEGWGPLLLPEALVAVAADAPTAGYRPNVCVTVTRVAGEVSLEEAAAATAARLEAAPEYEELGRERTTTFGLDAFRVEAGFATDYAGTLFQAAHVAVLPRGAFTDVLEIAGTCNSAQALDLVPVLRQVIGSAALQHELL